MSNAQELANLAANAIALAADLLGQAEEALDTGAGGIPRNQHASIHFQTVANQLERVFEELTGAPRLTVLSSTGRLKGEASKRISDLA